ncbi:alpha-amylase family glycosyl hydrolase [Niveibacterium sp.]|uniref:alpha-amylase family glycosyl hydrolase n=1 Tax=Niveibacterium sp. TaxID=2017444 RepID=UPI0035B0D2BE
MKRTNSRTRLTTARSTLAVLMLCAAGGLLSGCGSNGDTPTTTSPTTPTNPPPVTSECVASPLGDRALYLRGGFNSWGVIEDHKFTYSCNHYELVTEINGSNDFKVADESWSSDADFGGAKPSSGIAADLTLGGGNINYNFSGQQRFVLDFTKSKTSPTLTITDCPAAPFGATALYIRGGMNSWTATGEYQLKYSCDAYYANVAVTGTNEFKIADAGWTAATSYGKPAAASTGLVAAETAYTLAADSDTGGAGNLSFAFTGEHTVKVAFNGAGVGSLTIGPKTFVDHGAAAVTDPVALSVSFDSRDASYKAPFGAVTSGTAVKLGFTAKPGVTAANLVIEKRAMEGNYDKLSYTEVTRVPLTKATEGDLERWAGSYTYPEIGVFGYYFEVTVGDKVFLYGNNKNPVYWTAEKGSNGIGLIVNKPSDAKSIRRYRQTVYKPDFAVPDWAQDAIYYYIFPERFRNGDKTNDPNPKSDKYLNTAVEFHSNWLDKPYLPGSGDGSDATYNNDFFGGDLAGIIEKLDYIASLGANTLYINPVFAAGSNHKYDTADYKNIDPHFGTNSDFVKLTSEAAKRGLRVILDTSLNHSGSDSIYFDKFSRYPTLGAFEGGSINSSSPYASWYSFSTADPAKPYDGWGGSLDMPNLNKNSLSFRDYAYGASDSVAKLWMDRGIAGWRMDVAPWVPDDFWREWRIAVKGKDANALTVAETWFDASKFFLGDEFDTTMNYIFRDAILAYANGGNAKDVYENIELMRENYPQQVFFALMNLVSSHDVARALDQFGYTSSTQSAASIGAAKQKLRLATFVQMAYPGSPSIYYGDEVGVTGGADPYNRATYPWADVGGTPDTTLLADFKSLTKMRQDNAVLRRGSFGAPLLIDSNVIVHGRSLGSTFAVVATNNSTSSKEVTVPLPAGVTATRFRNALDGSTVSVAAGSLKLTIPATYGVVLVSQ